MKHNYTNIFLLLCSIFLFSCESNRWDVVDDEAEIELQIHRFEQALFQYEAGTFDFRASQALAAKYPQFYRLFSEGVMRFEPMNSEAFFSQMNRFLGDENIQILFKDVSDAYPDVDFLENKLSEAFSRYVYFFPDRTVPEIHTFLSAFSYSFVTDDSLLGIGLDNYLGADYEFYPQAGIPQYLFSHFSKEYMAADAMKAWLATDFESYNASDLLEQMVHQGKILYLTQVMLPDEKEQHILRYTLEEMQWCEENETEIWFHFVDNDILYTNENLIIKKYLGEAPFVTGFPEGSPGRVGQWMGLQIVQAYMELKKEASLQDLLSTDASTILTESRYKPDR